MCQRNIWQPGKQREFFFLNSQVVPKIDSVFYFSSIPPYKYLDNYHYFGDYRKTNTVLVSEELPLSPGHRQLSVLCLLCSASVLDEITDYCASI